MSILTYALHHEGEFNKNSLGAVSEGAKLAEELGGEAAAVVVGGDDLTDDLCASLGRYGASKVYRVKGPEGLAQPVVDAMAKVIADDGYKYALFGGGLLGFEIGAGPHRAPQRRRDDGGHRGAGRGRQARGRAPDPAGLGHRRRRLRRRAGHHHRPPERLRHRRRPATAPPRSWTSTSTFEDHSTKAVMVQRGEQRGADVNIEDADILVAGGRGLGKAEGFELCESLADALGGAVAATRAVVDAGWYPYAAQIGQTGKTVAPKLYLAAGISGAIQHKVGMQASENIVAINKDPNAPIFEFSDLGVVGDLNKIMPKLTEAVKAKKG